MSTMMKKTRLIYIFIFWSSKSQLQNEDPSDQKQSILDKFKSYDDNDNLSPSFSTLTTANFEAISSELVDFAENPNWII